MSCVACNMKRAAMLIKAREVMEEFDLAELMKELDYRWPNCFYIETDVAAKVDRIMHRNTVPPHEPYLLHTVAHE